MTEKEKRASLSVLMFISTFYPVVGGAQRQAQRLSQALVQQGVRTFVVTQHRPGLERHAWIQDVEVFRAGSPDRRWPAKVLRYTQWLWLLWRLRDSYDLIHAHQPFSTAAIGGLMGRVLHKPVIVKIPSGGERGMLSIYLGSRAGKAAFGILSNLVDAFIAVNKEIEMELMSLGVKPTKIQRIPNCIDTQLFRPPSQAEREMHRQRIAGKSATDEIWCIYVGRLIPDNNVSYLLELFEELDGRLGDGVRLRLVIVGEGSEGQRLRRQAAHLSNVMLVGSRSDVRPFLWAADIFLLPHLREGLSNALLEAMACGLAPVVTPVGGNLEVIRSNEDGLFIPLGATDEAARIIQPLIENGSLRDTLAKKARATVVDHYDCVTIAQKYKELYSRLLHERK